MASNALNIITHTDQPMLCSKCNNHTDNPSNNHIHQINQINTNNNNNNNINNNNSNSNINHTNNKNINNNNNSDNSNNNNNSNTNVNTSNNSISNGGHAPIIDDYDLKNNNNNNDNNNTNIIQNVSQNNNGKMINHQVNITHPQSNGYIKPTNDNNLDDILEDWQILKNSVIEGTHVKLVPYTADHVPTYNKWLNDPYIQRMTQTEPYSLEQEYEYQKEWIDDETKYIFIILDKTLNNCMAGDINIFIQSNICELNIMIAEHKSRRKGLATETLKLIIKWTQINLEIFKFIAKIQSDNTNSLTLFKKLGFKETDFVDTFKEYTLTYIADTNKK